MRAAAAALNESAQGPTPRGDGAATPILQNLVKMSRVTFNSDFQVVPQAEPAIFSNKPGQCSLCYSIRNDD
jgi:hypothetical protein